jgi:hypothetical protein
MISVLRSTRDQVKILRKEHPNWAKTDIARAVVPPVSPQRVGQIENAPSAEQLEDYRERRRHKYHKKNPLKYKRKKCKYCSKIGLDKGKK